MNNVIYGRTQNTYLQFLRYLFVGGGAAIVDTACLYFLSHNLSVDYKLAAAAGFILGLIVNYWISILWVFNSSGKVKEEFAIFALIGLGGLGWTELILWVLVEYVKSHIILAKLVAMILVLMWNFGMRKKFVFASISRRSC